jgi:hypothetical protein
MTIPLPSKTAGASAVPPLVSRTGVRVTSPAQAKVVVKTEHARKVNLILRGLFISCAFES